MLRARALGESVLSGHVAGRSHFGGWMAELDCGRGRVGVLTWCSYSFDLTKKRLGQGGLGNWVL